MGAVLKKLLPTLLKNPLAIKVYISLPTMVDRGNKCIPQYEK
jgi:hypothetical protein